MRHRVLPLVVLGGLVHGDPVPSSEVIGRVGSTAEISCPSSASELCSKSLVDWRWRPLNSNGWGWFCSRRNNTCNWEWDQLGPDSANWRSIFELETVDRVGSGIKVTDLGLHDNRQYAAVDSDGNILHIYSLKVGRKPSYPTDIECVSLVESMIMKCSWKIGLQSFLPWAKSDTSLRYKTIMHHEMYSEEMEYKLAFDSSDILFDCPKYCTEGNTGCCEFPLTGKDLVNDLNHTVTYQMEIVTTNLFGSSTMQKLNSKFPVTYSSLIHKTPAYSIKPLKPEITAIVAPPYDGYSMTVKWSHDQPVNWTVIYKVEYRLKTENNLPWQTTQDIRDYEAIDLESGSHGKIVYQTKLGFLIPFHAYEYRVKARPEMCCDRGYWSAPSDIVIGTTQPTEPTAKLNPKYSIINYTDSGDLNIRFFWLPYQQKNAANNRFRIRVKTGNCIDQYRFRTIWDGIITDATKTSHEVALKVDGIPCLNAEFVVENDKGATSPEIIPIDLFNVDTSAPNLLIRPLPDGKFQMKSSPDLGTTKNPTLYMCYGEVVNEKSDLLESDVSYRPICHRQTISNSDKCEDCSEKDWYNSKASLTPCYDYNIYLEITSKSNNSTVRSVPKAVTIDKLSVNMGQLGDIDDISKDGNPAVQITYALGNKDNIDIIYGMHPVISYKSMATDQVYHKKIKTGDSLIVLNSTDGLVGGSQTAFWLSLCCDELFNIEGINSCQPQTEQKIIKISAGTPGSVEHVELAWSKEAAAYNLHFIKPDQTNSPLRSYQIFIKYSHDGSDLDLDLSVPATLRETTVQLSPVCKSMLDEVHVTILAYGSDRDRNSLIPGQPVHRYFQCGDLIIVGLSAGIMFSISVLIIILIVMLVMSYIHRRRLKLIVIDAVWPKLEKPKIVFSGSNRDDDDHHWDAEGTEKLLQEYEESDILPEVIHIKLALAEKKETMENNSSGFDSGISEYSGDGSSKSVPIYRLSNRLGYRIDFRRTSNASSGISSQHSGTSGNSGKSGLLSVDTVSSNHSGDSVLAKDTSDWGKDYNFTISAKPEMAPEVMGKQQLAQYSVMGDSFNLTPKQFNSQTDNGYIGHGYVENSIFNLTNMPTVFLDNFKKIQRIREMDYDSDMSDNFADYGGYNGSYKPISALFPSQPTQLPPGYTTSNIFNIDPPEWPARKTGVKLESVFDDDYVADQFLPSQFAPLSKAQINQPPLPQAGYLPFDRAMKTFGIDEIPLDSLLSSRLSNVQKQTGSKIPLTYVSDYSSNFNLLSRNNIYVPQCGTPGPNRKPEEVPGYVSIEGAQILQQYS